MSPLRWPGLWLLASVMLFACAPPPAPPVVALAPLQAVAAPAEPPPAEAPEEPFVEDPDPGPVPVLAGDPWRGRLDAPVTLVVYGDFQCPFCMRYTSALREVERRYGPEKVRIVWKDYPLAFHQHARAAAVVAQLTFERFGNKGFWALHEAFFADTRDTEAQVKAAAERLGMSLEDVQEMARGQAGLRLDAAMKVADVVGVRGTPATFVNGVFIGGAQPIEKLAEVIDAQLVKARELRDRGTPARRVYVELAKAQWKPGGSQAVSPDKDDTTVWRVPIGKSPVRGKATALVTIVEFADMQCPFCAKVAPTVQQILAKYGDDVRLVWKHQPLPFHPRAVPAAALAIEARQHKGDAGFFRAHDLLFQKECAGNPQAKSRSDCEANNGSWIDNQQHLDDADLLSYAGKLGLNAARVQAAIDKHTHDALIEQDQDLADDLKAHGTPHFFINGRRLVGAQPLEKFTAIVDEELGKARDLVKSGIKPNKVYEHIMASAKTPPPPEKKAVPAPTRDNPSRGPASAKVVVQMFADFQCPFCARVRPTIEALENAFPGQIRVVWRNRPLPMHKDAMPAAEAAMEAFRQRGEAGFWAMHDALFASPSALDRASLEQLASQQGLDVQRFANALDTHAHGAAIAVDAAVAEAAGISGTPGFVINGYFVSGAQPLAKFKKVVRLALQGK